MPQFEIVSDFGMTRIPVPRAPTKVIGTFSHEQITKLLQLCNRLKGLGHRNLTILLLLLDSGLRVSELVNIDLDDAQEELAKY